MPPGQLEVLNETTATYSSLGRQGVAFQLVDRRTGQPYAVLLGRDGQPWDEAAAEAQERAAHDARCGRLGAGLRSFRDVLGPAIYARLYPDWRASQAADVERGCTAGEHTVWVADADGVVTGFVAYTTDPATKVGEVYMLAVDPAYQRRGLGARLNAFALDRLREAGMELAQVSTGGGPGQAPARGTYEKAGYTALPTVWYFQLLHPAERRPEHL